MSNAIIMGDKKRFSQEKLGQWIKEFEKALKDSVEECGYTKILKSSGKTLTTVICEWMIRGFSLQEAIRNLKLGFSPFNAPK